jgi:hypothetical protein
MSWEDGLKCGFVVSTAVNQEISASGVFMNPCRDISFTESIVAPKHLVHFAVAPR